MNETRALLSLAMSDDPTNWQLFHCYPLEDKLDALELFWNEVVDGLSVEIIKSGYFETDFIFETKLIFGISIRSDMFHISIDIILNYLIFNYKTIHKVTRINKIKTFFINYVTKHHE